MKRTLGLLGAVAAVTLGATAVGSWSSGSDATASSHREAPLIAYDPQADNTDVYAFVSPDRPDTVTIVANYIPLEAPYGGPNFHMFGDDVSYRIHLDNDGDAEEELTYEFRFNTTTRNENTFLYNTGPVTSIDSENLNVRQTYSIIRHESGAGMGPIVGGAPVAPAYVGTKSFPNYDSVAAQAVIDLPGGGKAFAGPRDDPFFVDLAGIFDLLAVGRNPYDGLTGLNTHSLVLQLPINQITSNRSRPTMTSDPAAVVGVWASAWRQSTKVFLSDGTQEAGGDWVQVSRLGAPLVNEVVIPRGMKDRFNASHPRDDGQFLNYVVNPELAALFRAVLNFPAPVGGRDDLVAVFLTGVDGLTKPANVTPAEMLRLNVAVPPSASPNRLGVVGGDTAGYPNGRRLADDVTDISLAAVGGVLKSVEGSAALGDGVSANDKAFLGAFPYVAAPHPGGK